MQKKQSITKNYFYNLVGQISGLVLTLMVTPYLSRTLGAEAIGAYSYTYSIVTYFILFGGLGTTIYGQREIAYAREQDKKRSRVFLEIFLLRIVFSSLSAIVYICFLIKCNKLKPLPVILMLAIIANGIDTSWYWQGIENFKLLFVRNLAVRILTAVLIFILIKEAEDVTTYACINMASMLFISIFILIRIRKEITYKTALRPVAHIKGILLLFLPQVAVNIYAVVDKTMLGFLTGDNRQVGYYGQAETIIKMTVTVITGLSVVMLSRISKLNSEGRTDLIREHIQNGLSFVLFLGIPLVFGTIALAPEFVILYLGKEFTRSAVIMQILSSILLFIGISNVLGIQYFLPLKNQKGYAIPLFVSAALNFLLNLILIPKYAAVGAAVSTVISEGMVVGVQLFYAKGMGFGIYVLKEVKNYVISSLIFFLMLCYLNSLNIYGIIWFMLKIVLGVVLYMGSLWILRDHYFAFLLSKILSHKNLRCAKFLRRNGGNMSFKSIIKPYVCKVFKKLGYRILLRPTVWEDKTDILELDFVRYGTLAVMAEEIINNKTAGALAEVGVYKGEFAGSMNSLFPNKKLYLFDTFEGFDKRDIEVEKANRYSSGKQDFSDTSVEAVLDKMKYRDNCVVRKGYFPETAAELEETFCLVSLDTDLYKPIKDGLDFFWPRLAEGGVIMVHDYNNQEYKGVKKAVNEWSRENHVKFVCIPDLSGSAIIIK